MRKALLPVYTAGHFTELLRVARFLRQSGRYAPVFWFSRSYHGGLARDMATCQAEAIACRSEIGSLIAGNLTPASTPTVTAIGRRHAMGAARTLLSGLPFPATAVRAVIRQGLELSRCRRLIHELQPDLLILAEDGVAYETATLIKAAHERRVPSAIIPFTICNATEPAEAYFRDPAYGLEKWENRLVARLVPRWVYRHRGRTMLRMPAAQLLAKELWRLAPPRPWQMNSGAADAVAVESEFMRDFYLREGLAPERLVVTGSLSDDALAENLRDAPARRAALCRELGLPAQHRLIVCALPPDQFAISGAQADAVDYPSLVRFWIQTLAALPDTNVVVRFHPRMAADAYTGIEESGVRISDRDTTSLIPLCDLFVASASATIRWAIACGKPTVNYDVYRFGWTDFEQAQGVIRVDDAASFQATLQRLMTDGSAYAEARARQEAEAPRWAQLDGHSGQRILQCLDLLVAAKLKEAGA